MPDPKQRLVELLGGDALATRITNVVLRSQGFGKPFPTLVQIAEMSKEQLLANTGMGEGAWQRLCERRAHLLAADGAGSAGQGPLTEAEHQAVSLAGQLYSLIRDEVVGDGSCRADDLREFEYLVHGIQHAVMAQAAARMSKPGAFRLLGLNLEETMQQRDLS